MGNSNPISFANETEKEAAYELYSSTSGGVAWKCENTWNMDKTVQTWTGISTNWRGRIIRIHIEGNEIVGHIPRGLCVLRTLSELSLGFNKFSGSIPDSIGELSNLRILNLNNNELTGHIPAGVGDLTRLQSLGLHMNKLTGPIPSSVLLLTGTKKTFADNIGLVLPSDMAASEVVARRIESLPALSMSKCNLFGSIPECVGRLQNLTSLNLADNRLTGCIPDLSGLQLLVLLDLGGNLLAGCIPESLGRLASLRTLHLVDNALTGPIPCTVLNLYMRAKLLQGSSKSTVVSLSHNKRLTLPDNLHDLAQDANKLSMISLALHGAIPDSISSALHLTQLSLQKNRLTGCIPSSLCSLFQLVKLDLSHNQLTGTIPPDIVSLSNLEWLYLNHNQLHGCIPEALGNLHSLIWLKLDHNELTGDVPPSLWRPHGLLRFDMSSNKLDGTISVDVIEIICRMRGSNGDTSYSCSDDFARKQAGGEVDLTGNVGLRLPADLAALSPAVSKLTLACSSLAGPIPSSLGLLANLTSLHLERNKLSGMIPDSLGSLRSLIDLNLTDNKLTGSIPNSFTNLTNLKSCYLLRHNSIDGGYEYLCFLEMLTFVEDELWNEFDLGSDASVRMRLSPVAVHVPETMRLSQVQTRFTYIRQQLTLTSSFK